MKTSTLLDILKEAMERDGRVSLKLPDEVKEKLTGYSKNRDQYQDQCKKIAIEFHEMKEKLEYLEHKTEIAHIDFWNTVKENLKPHEMEFFRNYKVHQYDEETNSVIIKKKNKR